MRLQNESDAGRDLLGHQAVVEHCQSRSTPLDRNACGGQAKVGRLLHDLQDRGLGEGAIGGMSVEDRTDDRFDHPSRGVDQRLLLESQSEIHASSLWPSTMRTTYARTLLCTALLQLAFVRAVAELCRNRACGLEHQRDAALDQPAIHAEDRNGHAA